MNAPVEARGRPACSTLPSSNYSMVGHAAAGGTRAPVPLALIWPVHMEPAGSAGFTDPIIWTVFKVNQLLWSLVRSFTD